MSMEIANSYQDAERAETYAAMEFPGTYYLAYRDLPEIISRYVRGTKAVDFGCGTGRSTRFLRKLGFDTIGIDISESMIKKAKELDPGGDYLLIGDGDIERFAEDAYDVVLSAFAFDNISSEKKTVIVRKIGKLLKKDGIFVNLVSSPDIYRNEWVSFSTKDFPENRFAKSGEAVRIIITDTEDERPVTDILQTDEDYRMIFEKAGLRIIAVFKPLGKTDEPYQWVNETRIPPWVIHVVSKTA